jgi:hypothetical protein
VNSSVVAIWPAGWPIDPVIALGTLRGLPGKAARRGKETVAARSTHQHRTRPARA